MTISEEAPFRTWAPQAPMGWNSWDCFGASVTEAEVKANADYVASHLKTFGYDYIVVDIQWYEATADSAVYHPFADLTMDDQGRLQPAPNRFPSAQNGQGFTALAAYVHGLGLKFGIHILRGIPRQAVHRDLVVAGGARARDIADNNICPWNSDMYGLNMDQPGAQAYYDSMIAMYAAWGVDFLKVDDIANSRLYGTMRPEIAALRRAIDRSGRPIVLSLSPGPTEIEDGAFMQRHANMWRLTDDFWDTWQLLRDVFPVAAKWAPFVQAGTWPDPDMLPLGAVRQRALDDSTNISHSRFTDNEAKTMLTLWSLLRAPLFLGGDLTKSGTEEMLYTNQDLLAMRAAITGAWEESASSDWVIWHAVSANAGYTACFNLSDTSLNAKVPDQATELWTHTKLTAATIEVPAHGVALFAQPQ
ncbi:alpha-galactosidase [Lacticaseibacillus yichunensis]|uniref:Alpha-galactosidase n=1 Tax=Lacticaseibacillus yichunensis TaxID=2486015 RepID=A0ABW4CPS9_9LACO